MLRGRLEAVSVRGRRDGQMRLEKEVVQTQNDRLEQENKQLREGMQSDGG